MNKPAFLVEGDLEQDFIQRTCLGAPVRKIGCNGDKVGVTAIAKRVGTQARLLQRRYNPIIVVFDREGREETCEQIEIAFREALQSEAITATVIVGIPDRDVEAWILADFEIIAEAFQIKINTLQGSCEGHRGKAKLKQMIPKDQSYVETIHGVAWLERARASRIAANSPSFYKFFNAMQGLSCRWLQEQHLI